MTTAPRSRGSVGVVLLVLLVQVVLAGTGAGLAGPAGAQAAEPDAMTIVAVDPGSYPTVTATVALPSAIADRDPVSNRFFVEEDGRARPATASRLPGDELEIVLLIDTSGSMVGAPMAAAKAAAHAFLEQVPHTARIAIVGFGSRPMLASPLTTDRAALNAAVDGLGAAGETALYDAVGLSLDQLAPNERTRRQVVLLSDGGDTASATSLQQATDRLAANGARLDVAELPSPESNHDALTALAAAARGTVVAATDPAALTPIYDGLGRGLANQYQVELQVTGHGPTTLRISVDLGPPLQASATTLVELPALPAPPTTAAPTTVAPAAPAPDTESVVEEADGRGWLDGSLALVLGGACVAGALLVLASLWFLHEPRRRARLGPGPAGVPPQAVMNTMVQRAVSAADVALERHGSRGWLNAQLERAGIALRPGEVVVITAAVMVVIGLLVTLLSGWLWGLLAVATVALVAVVVIRALASHRQRQFADQLGDCLLLMAGTLRTGYAVLPALDLLSREAPSPAAEEFHRVVTESRLGRDLNASLAAMADRVGGEDFTWVAQAVEINREVGGDLAEVLDNVAATIRERARVRRQVRTVSAEGRMSAIVLVALPIVMTAVMAVINPTYVAELTHGTGLVMTLVGVGLLFVGWLWTRRLVKVRY